MNCGVTLGVRCPACRTVLPVGSRSCTACGHSLLQKRSFSFPLWGWMKGHARGLCVGGVALLLVLLLVLAAFPAVLWEVSVPGEEVPILSHRVSGYELMREFLGFGASPESVEALLAVPSLKDEGTAVTALLFLAGFGWLLAAVALAFSLILLLPNAKRMGRRTARRLYAPLGVAAGGAVLLFAGMPALSGILREAADAVLTDGIREEAVIKASSPLPLVLLIAALAVLGLHTLLYLAVHRTVEGAGERSLGEIFSVPLRAAARLVRRVSKKLFRKKEKAEREPSEPVLATTPRFSSYLVLMAVSLVFTQALLSKISNIFFWFILLLPPVLLIYTLIARQVLTVSLLSDSVTVEKNTPHTYEFRIDNRSPLALPFVEAKVSIPQSNSVRCTERTVRLSLAPLSGYHLKNTVCFRFRGTYEIGVKCFYIYDFFRLFRARVDVEELTTVYVLPRRLTLEDSRELSVADSTARTVRSPLVLDKLEVSDIRDYRNGDSLKSIHWKLSSKSETFVVKDYNTGTSNETVIFCDLAAHYPEEEPKKAPDTAPLSPAERKKARRAKKQERKAAAADGQRKKSSRIKETKDTHAISDEDLAARLQERATAAEIRSGAGVARREAETMTLEELPDVHALSTPACYEDMNEYLADGVVEITIASVLAELRRGRDVRLCWFDRRSDTGAFAYSLRGADEFEAIYHLFATAPLCPPEKAVTGLTALVSDTQSQKLMFVVGALDTAMMEGLSSLAGVTDAGSIGSAEVLLYDPAERFAHARERAGYLEGCREQLAASGLSLTAGDWGIPPVGPINPPEGGHTHEI